MLQADLHRLDADRQQRRNQGRIQPGGGAFFAASSFSNRSFRPARSLLARPALRHHSTVTAIAATTMKNAAIARLAVTVRNLSEAQMKIATAMNKHANQRGGCRDSRADQCRDHARISTRNVARRF